MSIGLGVTQVVYALNQDMNDDGVKLTFPVWKPVNIQRFGFVNNHATATPTLTVLTLKHRVVAGDASSDVTIATLSPEATVERGNGLYKDMTDRVEANPGSEIIIEVTTEAGVANTGNIHLEYVPLPFSGIRIADMTEVE